MMKNDIQSYVGKKYGRYTVLSYSHTDSNYQKFMIVKCDCGNTRTVCLGTLRFGSSRSCGCLKNDVFVNMTKKKFIKHGKYKTKEYKIWKSIKARCLNENAVGYEHYGGRGITICKRWEKSFDNFILDMGYRPSENHSIDRIKNDQGYYPSNCRWATSKEQNRNRRSNVLLTYKGEVLILKDFSIKVNACVSSVSKYIQLHGAKQAVIYYSKKFKNAS